MIIRPRRARPDTYTKLLIKAFGANGSTTFKDFSQSGHVITAGGNAQMSTTQAKFPPVSMGFDGTGDYLTVPDSDDWNFGSGNFTIDFWVRFNSATGPQSFFYHETDSNNRYWFSLETGPSRLRFYHETAGVTTILHQTNWTPSTGIWYHLALVRNGNDFTTYVDGLSIGTTTDTDVIGNWTGLVYVGNIAAATQGVNGWMDNLRISKGIARWTANFTPPTRRY